MLTTWKRGREIVTQRREREEVASTVSSSTDCVSASLRRCAAVLARIARRSPPRWAMRVVQARVHDENVVVPLKSEPRSLTYHPPTALVIDELGYTDDKITHATARFGYMDQPDVPAVVRQLET